MADGEDFNAKNIAEFRANHGRVGGQFEGAPLLILHGTADQLWMPFAHAVALRDSAHDVGVPCEFFPLAGKNHGPWEGLDAYLADMTPFLRRYLGN